MLSEVEERYRQSNLSADIKQAKLGVLILVVPLVLFLFNDFQFFGLSTTFYELAAMRFTLLVFTVGLLAYFRRLKSFRSYDKAVFTWGLTGIIVITLINASRPENFLFHLVIVVATIVITYVVIPQKFLNRVILSLTASIGEFLILVLITQTSGIPESFSLTLILVSANIMGYLTSRLMETQRLRAFQAQEKIADLARFPSENPDPVMRVSKDHIILYANPAAKHLFGEFEVEVGKPLPSFIQTKYRLHGDFEVKHGDKTFLFSAASVADSEDANLYGLDITERKKDEELLILHETRLQSLLDLNKMVDASEKELVDFALEAIKKITLSEFAFIGFLNEDETVMTITSWSKDVMKECRAKSEPLHYPISESGLWAEPIKQRKPVFINDYSADMPHKKGLPKGHVEIKRYLGVPILEKDHIVAIGAVANKKERYTELDVRSVTRMVTDMRLLIQRKNAEEKLKESTRKIEIMNEKLRVSGSLTRHDVRNKLSTVTAYSFLLKKKYADKADVIDAAHDMEQAVADSSKIFDFARMYEQLGVEELKYVDVEEAINEAVALFSGLNLKVVNECHGLSLLADSFLRQLFYNLMDNTRKHGSKATTVKICYEKTPQDTLQLIYADDGVGIPKKNKPKLFAEGFSTGGSTGFGLFLIKRMMEVYGWNIQETGKAGRGVKFVITIPKINQDGRGNWQIEQEDN